MRLRFRERGECGPGKVGEKWAQVKEGQWARGSLGGGQCRGQGALTGEVAVQADGDIVKSHGGSGSLTPPGDNLQPEPVRVLRGVCVSNNLGRPRLRLQHPANGADVLPTNRCQPGLTSERVPPRQPGCCPC